MTYKDIVFILAVALVVVAGNQIQYLGAAGYIMFILLFATSAGSSMFERDKLPLWLFTGWGTAYVAFSYWHLLPPAWTVYYDKSVIPQQAAFVFAIWPIVSASQRFWRGPRSAWLTKFMSGVILASFALGCILDIIVAREFTLARVAATLKNDSAIVLFVITLYIFTRKSALMHGVLMLMTLYVGVLQSYLQTLLTYVYAWFLRILDISKFALPRLVLLGVVASALLGTVYGLRHIQMIWELDKNTGWRLLFWHGSLQALVQTHGIGVGFGTEALQNYYRQIPRDVFMVDDTDSFLLVGTHNAFFDVALRLGIVGLALILVILFQSFPSRKIGSRLMWHATMVFFMIFICMYLNVALQSPTYSIGMSFLLGYLRGLNREAASAASRRIRAVPPARRRQLVHAALAHDRPS